MSDDAVTVELDDYARDLLTTYEQTAKQIRDLDALRVKARDQLMNWMALRGGSARVRGTVDGNHAVTFSAYEILEFDVRNFREDQPALYASYAHPAPRRMLRLP
jgi:hypothetical protein